MGAAKKVSITSLERELNRIFSSLGHGMYIMDKDARVVLWNRSAESILGWSEDEVLGKKCEDFVAHQSDEGKQLCNSVCPLKASVDEERATFTGSVWAHAKDGSLIPVNVSCIPLFNDSGEISGTIEIFTDITGEKEIMRMRDDIATAVTHMLKSPLTAIKGSLELLIDGEAGEITDEQRDFLEIIEENTNKLLELATDYLDLDRLKSRGSVLHWEQVQLGRLIDDTVSNFKLAAAEKYINLESEIGDTPPILGDPAMLKTMVGHLVKNAIQYTIEGEVRVSYRTDGKTVSFTVADTGVGIPRDEQDRLGERFFRASTASITGTGGSGLGITITKEIIARHGGTFELESLPGKGTRITVTFETSTQDRLKDVRTCPEMED